MSSSQFDLASIRQPLPGVDPQFYSRWSPRKFQAYTMERSQLARMIDAARYAPSCFNEQPWRFYTSNQQNFNEFLQLLVEANQQWAKDASTIGFLVATRQFKRNGKANAHARFDSGAAWMSLCLQAQHEGLHCHGMAGIDYPAIEQYLSLDNEQYDVVMAFAIGKLADPQGLTDDEMRAEQPSNRIPLEEIWTG